MLAPAETSVCTPPIRCQARCLTAPVSSSFLPRFIPLFSDSVCIKGSPLIADLNTKLQCLLNKENKTLGGKKGRLFLKIMSINDHFTAWWKLHLKALLNLQAYQFIALSTMKMIFLCNCIPLGYLISVNLTVKHPVLRHHITCVWGKRLSGRELHEP